VRHRTANPPRARLDVVDRLRDRFPERRGLVRDRRDDQPAEQDEPAEEEQQRGARRDAVREPPPERIRDRRQQPDQEHRDHHGDHDGRKPPNEPQRCEHGGRDDEQPPGVLGEDVNPPVDAPRRLRPSRHGHPVAFYPRVVTDALLGSACDSTSANLRPSRPDRLDQACGARGTWKTEVEILDPQRSSIG
jgi:hypothetical protein